MAKKRNFVEVPMNLLTVPQGWLVCFATDSDVSVGVGLPKLMNDTYHLEKQLSGETYDPGTAVFFGNCVALVVKESCYDNASETYLEEALADLRKQCLTNGFDRVAMPKICTGNNGLTWKVVKKMIKETFKDTGIFVMICS
jgi:hypothetical protein